MASYHPSSSHQAYLSLTQAREVYDQAAHEASQLADRSRSAAAAYLWAARRRLRDYRQGRENAARLTTQALLESYLARRAREQQSALYEEAITLALSAAEQIIQADPKSNARALAQLLKKGLERVVNARGACVYAHPDELESIRTLLAEEFPEGGCTARPGECPRGSLRIETPSGQIEFSWREALSDFLARARALLKTNHE